MRIYYDIWWRSMLTDKVSCYLMKVRSYLRVSMIYDEGTYSPTNDLALSISYVYIHACTCIYMYVWAGFRGEITKNQTYVLSFYWYISMYLIILCWQTFLNFWLLDFFVNILVKRFCYLICVVYTYVACYKTLIEMLCVIFFLFWT